MPVGEWDHRELCPDGACVGVIGPTGTCKVCGRAAANWGEERKRGLVADAGTSADDEDDEYEDDDDEHEDDDDAADDEAADELDPIAPTAPATLGAGPPAWSERTLCPDGACIGVIGADGRCRVCGKRRPTGPEMAADDAMLATAAAELAAVAPEADVAALTPAPPDADAAPPMAPGRSTETDDPADDPADEPATERKLCPEGACVGVIGADGTCKLCGAEAG